MSLTIEEILDVQKQLQEAMGNPMGDGEQAAKENVLAAIVELTEVLGEINWKPWKRHKLKEIDQEALLTEMCDVLQFWANMITAMGFTPNDVEQILRQKWRSNYHRISNGETTNASKMP